MNDAAVRTQETMRLQQCQYYLILDYNIERRTKKRANADHEYRGDASSKISVVTVADLTGGHLAVVNSHDSK